MPSATSALTATRSPRRSAGFHVTGVAGDATLSSRCAVSRLRSLALPVCARLAAFGSDHHSIAIAADVTLSNPAAPAHLFSTACLAASGGVAALMPSASLRSSSAHPLRIRIARAGSAHHRLPHSAVLAFLTAADATARASGSVLRTPAGSSVDTDFHSVAVAAPFCRLRRRRSPFAHTSDFPFLTAWRGLWYSHPTHRGCRSGQCPPSRNSAETHVDSEPYGSPRPAPPSGFLEKRRRDRFLF